MLSVKRYTPISPRLKGNLVESTIICCILKNNGIDNIAFSRRQLTHIGPDLAPWRQDLPLASAFSSPHAT